MAFLMIGGFLIGLGWATKLPLLIILGALCFFLPRQS